MGGFCVGWLVLVWGDEVVDGKVRSLRLVDVDRGMRRVRVVGKGNKESTAPIDSAFFTELGNYLRAE